MPYHVGEPLVYAIDDWHQLANARSNTDPALRIIISDFMNSDILTGTRITVTHPIYGVLLSILPKSAGRISSYDSKACLTIPEILRALKQLGFDVQFKERIQLTEETYQILQSAKTLGFTHIRYAPVTFRRAGKRSTTSCVIAFNERTHPELIAQVVKRPVLENTRDVIILPKDPGFSPKWIEFPLQIDSVLTNNIPQGGKPCTDIY